MLTDNFFRPRWVGVGDRRIKNAGVVLEFVPTYAQHAAGVITPLVEKMMPSPCGTPTCSRCSKLPQPVQPAPSPAPAPAPAPPLGGVAAVAVTGTESGASRIAAQIAADPSKATLLLRPSTLALVTSTATQTAIATSCARYVAMVTLAEAETIRKVIHTRHPVLSHASVALHTTDGSLLDCSKNYIPEPEKKFGGLVQQGLQCARFYNCEMYFSEKELEVLEEALAASKQGWNSSTSASG
eukprot:TRINITY_DN1345_c0_g1_i1.p1 TRINITY_DN1345_c0_g1~~TRINITY_DN1345_c0_g1_i1.p1  ORF type:complete len:240 (+),score=48.34 TRINITY_DN1345_c0_g1_i1:187-906(+)